VTSGVEVLPDPENRIEPDFTRRDAAGLPRPRVHFRLTPYEIAGVARARATHDAIFAALKCKETSHIEKPVGGCHLIGTFRMGANPRSSVVRDDLQTHQHPNLFLLGSGVFPTAGSANPTLTIAALTLRAVDGAARAVRE
jgi:choline dehydrogenase-like flavoprotein